MKYPDAAIDSFVADTVCLLSHVLRDPAYPRDSDTTDALIESVMRHELPPLPVFREMVVWVCFITSLRDTTTDVDVRAAALRLSDAINGTRH